VDQAQRVKILKAIIADHVDQTKGTASLGEVLGDPRAKNVWSDKEEFFNDYLHMRVGEKVGEAEAAGLVIRDGDAYRFTSEGAGGIPLLGKGFSPDEVRRIMHQKSQSRATD
jgi:hypothetical protein